MKRIADTSRAAAADLLPSRASREYEVLDALNRYRRHHGLAPTAYELLRWMQIERPGLDLNGVRPRLTELKDAGLVQTDGKRECLVTLKRVYVWTAIAPQPVVEPAVRSVTVQEVLF